MNNIKNIIIALLLIVVIVEMIVIYNLKMSEEKNVKQSIESELKKPKDVNEMENEDNKEELIEDNNFKDYFILYDGLEIKKEIGIQYVDYMRFSKNEMKKYEINYYNYERGKTSSEFKKVKGEISEETYEDCYNVLNVGKIAISENINLVPRNFKKLKDIPNEIKSQVKYPIIEVEEIDLDGDDKNEYIVLGKDEENVKSIIIVFDSNYKKIANLVILEDGYWSGIRNDENKVFLKLEDIAYIDINNDGKMEIIVEVPSYESTVLSIYRYDRGSISGQVGYKAVLKP